jgi:hypothetical protein
MGLVVFLIILDSPDYDPLEMPLVDAWTVAYAWLDEDYDGQEDDGEPPLGGVFIFEGPYDYELAQTICDEVTNTNDDGLWEGEFYAGGTCDGIIISAYPPEGYIATTPLQVDGCFGKFGFAPIIPTTTLP